MAQVLMAPPTVVLLGQLARLTLACAQTGRTPREVSDEEDVDLPDLAAARTAQLWRFYAANADQALGRPAE